MADGDGLGLFCVGMGELGIITCGKNAKWDQEGVPRKCPLGAQKNIMPNLDSGMFQCATWITRTTTHSKKCSIRAVHRPQKDGYVAIA